MIDHIIFEDNCLKLLDQRLLPNRCEYVSCCDYRELVQAIKSMVVRGAPAIGVAAAYGCCLAALEQKDNPQWRGNIDAALQEIENARPTAVNLAWAVGRMRKALQAEKLETTRDVYSIWLDLARKIQAEDIATCHRIGEAGNVLLRDGDTVLTHCNAGALATAGYGTALAPVRAAIASGKKIKVIADETRPLLQGARLTAWELANDGIPISVACDNACATLMARGLVQIVITGADRIAANGDTANKTGTCGVAIMAAYYGLPFYIAAPLSTIDAKAQSGADIPIEERPRDEVARIGSTVIMPEAVPAWNFAFDVTPATLIAGIITEAGILRPPYAESIARALASGKA